MQGQIVEHRIVRALVGIVLLIFLAWIWACLWVPLS
jgi:hypothetical protein